MGIPISQIWTVASYVIGNKLRRKERYPLVLMLEPLFRCNLACAGCGKIQYPQPILKKHLTPEECFRAVDECGAPIVSIPGGEPLLHPQIDEIVTGLIERKKYIYLCTNALLLEKSLPRFKPSKYLTFSVHIDGPAEEHDAAVCREGVYDIAVKAIRVAIQAGHRVTTNTTLFNSAEPERVRQMCDELSELGVEGMMLSPGYPYEKAPDQEHFLHREETKSLFRKILNKPKSFWRFNQSPLFLEFLQGKWDLECTPWGNPTYNIFGWQKPCYLLDEGYVATFQELMEHTQWSQYGPASGNPKCTDCMVHCGFEATAVSQTFSSWRAIQRVVKLALVGSSDSDLMESPITIEADSQSKPHVPQRVADPHKPLVQLDLPQPQPVEA